jgi:DNA-binding transcriptional MerR regulator
MSETTYTFAGVAKILDVSESKLRYWAQIGFVGPSVRETSRMLFSFQDLVSVKAAKELVERGFTVTQIRKALGTVRASLPHVDRPLDRIRVAFDGETLVVIDDGAAFEVTGQKVFAFGLGDLASRAAAAPTRATKAARLEADGRPRPTNAYQWFTEGIWLEEQGQEEPEFLDDAIACYRKALSLDAGLAAAHTNLGRIAHRRGDVRAARESFEEALALDPDQPEARFNLANLILEGGDLELAVAELRRVLQVAPDFADAHYNLAVALERLGGRAQARAHLERYLGLDGDPAAAWATEARVLIERLAE